MLASHNLVENKYKEILYERRPCLDTEGNPVEGLYNAWIFLNNPKQYNSYTTNAVKEVILAMREASMDRAVNAIVFTAVGDKAFCTGGNTKEYAEYYAGNPQEYKQYLRMELIVLLKQFGNVSISLVQSFSTAASNKDRSTSPLLSFSLPNCSSSPVLGMP